MAQQIGAIQIQGTIGNVVFRRDGAVATKPASRRVTAKRTLENNTEFGLGGSYGKLIRETLRSLVAGVSDRGMVGRLTKAMVAIIKADDVNDCGQRVFDKVNSAPLLGFDFNLLTSIGQVFFAPRSIAAQGATVTLSIPTLNPLTDVKAPQGATHYEVVFGAADCDMAAMKGEFAPGASLGIQPLNGPAIQNLTSAATLPAAPAADNLVVGAVGIRFYQEVNGKYYPLDNSAGDALTIEYVD